MHCLSLPCISILFVGVWGAIVKDNSIRNDSATQSQLISETEMKKLRYIYNYTHNDNEGNISDTVVTFFETSTTTSPPPSYSYIEEFNTAIIIGLRIEVSIFFFTKVLQN